MKKITLTEAVLFSLYAAMMFVSTKIDFIPNVHQLALFMGVFAVVYGKKGFIPVLLYIALEGVFGGFGVSWIPYLYIWPIMMLSFLLVPKKIKRIPAVTLFAVIGGLNGILFGLLYTPFQMLAYHFDVKAAISWWIFGLQFDVNSMVGNILSSFLIVPVSRIICKLEKREPNINIT